MKLTREKAMPMKRHTPSLATCSVKKVHGASTPKKEKDRSENKERESLRRFGEFQNVFLSEGELASLQSDFPNRYVEYIDRLSVYMASNGRHYANHYATMRKWLNEDIRSGDTKNYTAEDYSEGECL